MLLPRRPHLPVRAVLCRCNAHAAASDTYDRRAAERAAAAAAARNANANAKPGAENGSSAKTDATAKAANASAGPSRRHAEYRFPTRGARGGPPDPYEVLGLPRGAGAKEIKAAYYKLALILHPDSTHPSASSEHFATLSRAYKLLSSAAGRSSYLQTGYGWSATGEILGAESSADAAMRDFIRHAKAAGASEWRPRGFRDSEAGRGAWTYHHYHGGGNGQPPPGYGGPGGGWPYAEEPPQGKGEELYMSNNRFVILIAAIAGIATFMQVTRAAGVAESTSEQLLDRHIGASQALAEARREAALFGRERREAIHRRVRENQVLGEIERMERGHDSPHGAGAHLGQEDGSVKLIAPPASPSPPPPSDGHGPAAAPSVGS